MTRELLHRWYMPFLWLTLASLVSLPMAIYLEHGMTLRTGPAIGLAYGSGWVARSELLAALMPYLLNLAAAAWFFSENGSTRWAAFWATLVAVARIVAPVALAQLSSVPAAGAHYVDWHAVRYVLWFQDVEMFLFGIGLWAIFARFVGNGASAPAPAGYYAEA